MRHWRWLAAVLMVMLLAACVPITAPAEGTGEAAPEQPAAETSPGLTGVVWQWQSTQAADGTEVAAADPSRYTLTFMEDGSVGAQFDCNSGGGGYTVDGDSMTLGPLITTLMACPEGSQADVFSLGLDQVVSFAVDGETLTLTLADGSTMTFAAAAAESVATEEPAEEEVAVENPLVGTTWQWTETVYGDESMVTAADPARYTLTFEPDGSLVAQVDCNRGMGSYTLDGESLRIGPLATTRMACPEGSQADLFLRDLERTATFVFDGPELVLNMKFDSGNMYFSPAEM